ncbi:Uncharacterized protein dnl_10430 [Desulfonema limicola]|uniref:TonB-dependent receptor plug domain-containing protein n=1 Tax=Desulfonema limicola TaxID=45656 RepID=A0A975B4W3_9BACT|nr:hypothetical protein [Desulfonema limicola]QTA78804.1 Uncharacterized protein dnl_10430 [Desulfonema limicola]
MPVTHVCFAVILSLSAGFAQSMEYMVSPVTEYVKVEDEVSVENIYQHLSAIPDLSAIHIQTGKQNLSNRMKKSKSVKIEKPALKQNPNSVFKNVVIKKLIQSM